MEFGEKSCFVNGSFAHDEDKEIFECPESKNAFILVFVFSAVFLAVLSDWLYDKLSRTIMLSVGTATFSVACLLMGLASSYWQLVILRMMIAAGLSVCR